jgi:hypothetical protein
LRAGGPLLLLNLALALDCPFGINGSAHELDVVRISQLTDSDGPKQMGNTQDQWISGLEEDLAPLASDMWGTQKQLVAKGFRVDGGNKSSTGSWWLTANHPSLNHRSIKVQSDATRIIVTVAE